MEPKKKIMRNLSDLDCILEYPFSNADDFPEAVSEAVTWVGTDYIIGELTEADSEEPFAEEKAAERKTQAAKKREKQFGEW